MADIERNISCFGKEKNRKKLLEVVGKEDPKVLQKLLSSKLGHADACQMLNYIFMGLSNSGSSQAKRMKLIQHVLDTLPEKEMSTSEANRIISCLSHELIRLNSSHMIRLSQWCVENIQKSGDKFMAWKELLPNLLNVLSTWDNVEHSETVMTGSEYRRQVVNSLCMMSWKSDIITPLAVMFTNVELSPDEHLQVVLKLCEGIQHLEPTSLPPLVNQLLLLSSKQHGLPLFLHLQQYFTQCLYDRIRIGAQESCSQDFISEDIMLGKRRELLGAESTILFYINQSANVGHANVRDFLNSLKSTMTAPELFLNPFFLTVLLSMSFVPSLEYQVLDIIKSAVTRVLAEEKRKAHSAWLQDVIPTGCDLERLINQLVESSGRDREMVREGLVKLAFVFLRAGGSYIKESGHQVWKYGRLILFRLIRKHSDVVSTVVQSLCNEIILGPHVTQYVDTLLKLSVSVPLLLSECQTILKQLIEQLLLLPGSVAQQVVVCVMPLSRTFPSVRDCLMLVLRKAVYSCTLDVRLMAIKGFLLLLRTLDTRSLSIATQSSQSSQSTLSQVHTEFAEGEETVGTEVIGVFRRCATLQAEVRSALYKGILGAVSKNRVLVPLVLELLLDLLKDYYKSDEIVQPPLDFDKIVFTKDMDVNLMEPLAELIFVAQQFVTRRSNDEEIENNKSLKGLQDILDLLCKRMTMCSLENLGLVEGVNLNDILPESRCLNEIYHQALGVYEALIAYSFAAWSLDKRDRHQNLLGLFRSYAKVVEFGKTSGKTSKNNENKGDRTQKNKSLKKVAEKHGIKGKLSVMKKKTTVLDVKSATIMMEGLFAESVPWADDDDIRPLKSRREIPRYALHATLQLLQQVHSAKYSDLQIDSDLFSQCSQIGCVLYQRFIHLEEDTEKSEDEDAQVVVLAIECWIELLATMFLHFESQLPQFFEDMGGVEFSKGLSEQLEVPIKCIQMRLVASLDEEYDTDMDPVIKKLPLLLTNSLSQLALHLPRQSSFAIQLLSWLKKFVSDKTITNVPVVKEILSLFFKLQITHKVDGALFDNVALQLLNLMETINEDTPVEHAPRFAILTEVTQIVCLQQLCAAIKHMIDDIDWTVAHLRGMFAGRAYPSSDTTEEKARKLTKQEQELCSHTSHVIKVVTILVRISLPEGPAMDAVLKLLISIYNSVSSLAKYFCNRSSRADMAFQSARFTHVVHLTASELAKHVQWLLLHVTADPEEEEDDDDEDRKKSKKGKKLKLAREQKDSKLVPRIVYGMEMFEKNVISLSKKCNVNLMERVKVSAGRDFRIKMEKLKTSPESQEGDNEEEEVEQEAEREPEAGSDVEDEQDESPEQDNRPRKKRRTS